MTNSPSSRQPVPETLDTGEDAGTLGDDALGDAATGEDRIREETGLSAGTGEEGSGISTTT